MLKRLYMLFICVSTWELLVRISGSPVMISTPRILTAMVHQILSGNLWTDMRVSLLRIAAGFLIATIFGIVLGTLIYQNKVIEQTIMPLVDAVRPLSALALFPLIILLFGIGEASKVFVIFFTAWPPILINTLHGLREVDKATIEAAKVDGASKWHTLINITMPLALPTIVTGLKIGLSTGWISLVAAEMLGAQSGLGYSIVFYANSFQYPDMFAVILTVALLGLAINSLATNIQRLAYFEKENE